MSRLIHVVGAGLAGLAAAVQLQRRGARVILHEAAPYAGGRCRSYFDIKLNATIDNGNHVVLSGNHATLAYLKAIGAADELVGPSQPELPFVDVLTNARWTVRLSAGRMPAWIFDSTSRVPGTQPADYLSLARLLFARPGRTIAETLRASGRLWDALAEPLLLAALNVNPRDGSAALAGNLLKETLLLGGQACRPMVARNGLGHAFIDPALRLLQHGGAQIRLGTPVLDIGFDESRSHARVSSLGFDPKDSANASRIALAPGEGVVLAVSPNAARQLVPGLSAPDRFSAIVNAHFAIDPPLAFDPMTVLLNGAAQWLFAVDGRLSVTIHDAERLLDMPREELARTLWLEVAKATKLPPEPMPPWQIVLDKRATFAAFPAQENLRPATRTRWSNLMLAGDWTATGLPPSVEGAIRSGQKAADLLMNPSVDRR